MSKKIHLCAKTSYRTTKPWGTSQRTSSRIFCGVTNPAHFYSWSSYMWYSRHGDLDDSRICKSCLEWVPMYILSQLP